MKEYERVALTKDRLREAMTRAGKKQVDLVRETGLNRGTVSRYLSGEVEPRHEATHKLAKALDVSEMWLFGYDVPMQRPEEQKKNDQLVELIALLRRNPDLFDFVVSVSQLSAEDYISVKRIVASLVQK